MKNARLFSVLLVVITLFIGGAFMEGTVRAYAAVSPTFGMGLREFDPMAVQIEPHGHLGYRQRPNSSLHYANGTVATANAMRFRGPEVPPHPDPGTIRIILLGGSTTHGFGVNDDQTIDAHMRRLLKEKYPSTPFEVVNLALDGYDAYQLLQRLQTDGLPMSPSIVVLNTGINDVRNAHYSNLTEADPRTLIWESVLGRLRLEQERGGPSFWTLTKHYLYVARAPGYVAEQLRRRQTSSMRREATAPMQAGTARDGKRAGPPYPDAADFFERYVRRMVDSSLAKNASVLLSTPPSALRSYRPDSVSDRSYWVVDAKTTQEYRDELAHRLRMIDSSDEAQHRRVRYVAPSAPLSQFLDDCHLTSDGNRTVAEAFVKAIEPFIADQTRK